MSNTFNLDIGKGFQHFIAGRILGPFGQVLQSLTGGKSFLDKLSDTGDFASNYIKGQTGSGLTQSQIEQNEWTASREDTQYQRGVQDLEAAGLNPAMVYGKGGQPAPSSPSASPSVGSMSDLLEFISLPLTLKKIQADIALENANARRANADASATEQSLPYLDELYQLKNEGVRLANSMTNAEIQRVYEQINVMKSEVKSNEARALLDEANAWQVRELTPLSAKYIEAQTEAEKAQAYLFCVQAAVQNKLISSGYFDEMVAEMRANAQSAQAKADVDQIAADIRAGRYGNNGKFINNLGSKALAAFANVLDLIPIRVGSVISSSNSTSLNFSDKSK